MTQLARDNTIQRLREDKKRLTYYAVLLGSFLFCYAKVFAALFNVWWNSEIYSYGFLVPFISLYLIWIRRDKLKYLQHSTSYLTGFTFLAAGMLTLLLGRALGVVSLQGLSLVTTVIGIIILLFGKYFFRAVWFPIAYLLFMVPFWDRLIEWLHLPLQNFSAAVGIEILQVVGMPAFRESIYIELPNITLEVAKVCSGVNNLIAVVAIAIPLAYLTIRSWTRRFILVSGGIIIAILFNGLRVALIGVLAYYGISKVLHGPLHILQAMSVSLVGFIILFVGAWILSDRASAPSPNHSTKATQSDFYPMQIYISNDKMKYPLFLAACILNLFGIYINFWFLIR